MTIYRGNVPGDVSIRPGDDAGALTSVGGHLLPDAETAKARLEEVARHALADPANLDMRKWHNESGGCGTSHCISGWAVHLAGDDGYKLEREVQQPTAGVILLGVEASKLFYLSNEAARSALHRVLDGKPAL